MFSGLYYPAREHDMKIVHFADLHLDAAFAWCGASGDVARRRRQALRDTLNNIIEIVREVDAGALFCAGDLYEHDRVTPDTGAFLRKTFAELDPVRVYIAPGNHDWYGPESLYATQVWSKNVYIFKKPQLDQVELADNISLWGAAHCQPANTPDFVRGSRISDEGIHIALFHGAERAWFSEQGSGKGLHAPFEGEEIARAGFRHAFLGHYHRPKLAEYHTYPGNPDPLKFGENGRRGPVVVTISPDGSIRRERRSASITSIHDLTLDVTGCTHREEVRRRLGRLIEGRVGVVRLEISGDLDPSLDLRENVLRDVLGEQFDAFQIGTGDLRPAYDFDAIKREPTVRGQFVRDVLEAELEPDETRRVLITGLRALDGRNDLEVF